MPYTTSVISRQRDVLMDSNLGGWGCSLAATTRELAHEQSRSNVENHYKSARGGA